MLMYSTRSTICILITRLNNKESLHIFRKITEKEYRALVEDTDCFRFKSILDVDNLV